MNQDYLDVLEKKILVIGSGSIGRRHISNLVMLGFKNINVYSRGKPKNLPDSINILGKYDDLSMHQFYAIIVCSPTALHGEHMLMGLDLTAHTLVEKPIVSSYKQLIQIENHPIFQSCLVRTGYMLRFHPLIIELKKIIESRCYGDLISFTTFWGEHLSDWHPDEDYRTSYAARTDLGGGAALTLSHDIDLILWIVSSPLEYFSKIKNTSSKLAVDVEAGVDILYKFQNGVTGHTSLNFYSKKHERYLRFVLDEATLVFDYYKSQLSIHYQGKEVFKEINNFDRNSLFIDEIKNFFHDAKNFNLEMNQKNINLSKEILKICDD